MNESPEDLERRRLQKRLVELRNQLAEISGGEHMFGPAGDGMTLEMEVAFLEQIIAFETAPKTSWLEVLSDAGYDMPDPATLSDAEIGLEVWQVIQRLSELCVYLSSTDHLSDRQLYEHLYQDSLREVTQHMPDDPDSACHIDILGGCSDADLELWLRYYVDDQERADWVERFPDYVLPEREKPPFERDHLLPMRTYEPSPLNEYLNRLANTGWDDPQNPMHVSSDVAHHELTHLQLYQTAWVLLDAIQEAGRVKATAKLGNLTRAFIKEIYPQLPLDRAEREMRDQVTKVIDEADLRMLHKVRIAVQEGGLIRLQKGSFSLTKRGKSLLEPDRGGELFRALFVALFEEIDLAYFDRLPELPVLQGVLPICLWRLCIVGREWMDSEESVVQTLVPGVIENLDQECPEFITPGRFLSTRLWQHLVDFGILEENLAIDESDKEVSIYRITPLFDRVLSFDPLDIL